MFKPIDGCQIRPEVIIYVNGKAVHAREGESLAMAMLEAGIADFRRTPVSNAPRGPYCLMGVCFECLVEVDGRQNVQACCTEVRDAMRVTRQLGARHVESEE